MTLPGPARCFVASSKEGLAYADAMTYHLERAPFSIEVVQWNLTAFTLGHNTMTDLQAQLEECDFGVFMVTPDDTSISRSRRKLAPRDNVIFELGLFAGRLGLDRAFVAIDESADKLKYPSDLLGVTFTTFTQASSPQQQRQRMRSAAVDVIERIRVMGPVSRDLDQGAVADLVAPIGDRIGSAAAQAGVPLRGATGRTFATGTFNAIFDLLAVEDAYARWLVPDGDDAWREAYTFNSPPGAITAGEQAMATHAWNRGSTASHTDEARHPSVGSRTAPAAMIAACAGETCAETGVLILSSPTGLELEAGQLAAFGALARLFGLATVDVVPSSGAARQVRGLPVPVPRPVRGLLDRLGGALGDSR